MKTYNRAELESKKLSEIKQIARGMNLRPDGDLRSKNIWINAIIAAMPQEVAPKTSDFTLEPIPGTLTSNAYRVNQGSQSLGIIFHNKQGFPILWDCGDGRKYANSEDCIQALLKIVPITNTFGEGFKKIKIGEKQVFTTGKLNGSKLWKNYRDNFYYANAHDAASQTNPVAIRAQQLNEGDTILVNGRDAKIIVIESAQKLGVGSRCITTDLGVTLNCFFFDLVAINSDFKQSIPPIPVSSKEDNLDWFFKDVA